MEQPLILVTNDDGIDSSGLWAAAEALLPLGEILVVAPDRQWTGAGRSMPPNLSGQILKAGREVQGRWVDAYSVDATPAVAVILAILELAPRSPSLVVSGINFGENVSTEITVSGTVGAALEAAAHGIPALAVSLAMPVHYHLLGNAEANYAASAAFTQRFARLLLNHRLPYDVDLLNINVPQGAEPESSWRLTRISRRRYFLPLPPDRENGKGKPGYRRMDDFLSTEPDSDIRVLNVDSMVSVTPISLDMTSRADFGAIEERLRSLG